MSDRTRKLQRIASLQKKMAELAELRAAAADRDCARIGDDRDILRDYVGGQGAADFLFAQTMLRASKAMEMRLIEASSRRDATKEIRDYAKRRERAGRVAAEVAIRDALRVTERRALAETVEAWLAHHAASLP